MRLQPPAETYVPECAVARDGLTHVQPAAVRVPGGSTLHPVHLNTGIVAYGFMMQVPGFKVASLWLDQARWRLISRMWPAAPASWLMRHVMYMLQCQHDPATAWRTFSHKLSYTASSLKSETAKSHLEVLRYELARLAGLPARKAGAGERLHQQLQLGSWLALAQHCHLHVKFSVLLRSASDLATPAHDTLVRSSAWFHYVCTLFSVFMKPFPSSFSSWLGQGQHCHLPHSEHTHGHRQHSHRNMAALTAVLEFQLCVQVKAFSNLSALL